ncbi:MAG: zinc ribbon domain-containing protein [Candidatus Micrarchaeia archaeon]
MGILDGLANKVKSDLEWKAGQEISTGVAKGASKVLNKDGSSSGDKSKCPKCKKPITESGLKFCPECGAKLTLTCKKCAVDYPVGTKFCTKCGTALKD